MDLKRLRSLRYRLAKTLLAFGDWIMPPEPDYLPLRDVTAFRTSPDKTLTVRLPNAQIPDV